jgi:hypothetical protein
MKQRYLEVTFRKGKPFAAYLYLPRPAGSEITAPSAITASTLNAILASFGVDTLGPEDFAPLAAA